MMSLTPWKAIATFFADFWKKDECVDCGSISTWLNECNEVVCNHCGHVHMAPPTEPLSAKRVEHAAQTPLDADAVLAAT